MISPYWPKIAVVGAGAIGGLFGGLLRQGGLNVTLIDRWSEHVNAINQHGLAMTGHGGERSIAITATTDAASVGPVDVVIVQTKAMHTIEAVQGAMVIGPGVVHNYSDLPSYIGELEGGLSARAERIAEAFTAAGLETHASGELRKMMWKKYLANVALSAASGSTNLNSQQMMAIPELKAVCIGAMEEAALVAAAEGILLTDTEKQEILAPLISPEGTGASKSSLCTDLLKERPTEIDTIAGAVVRLGREHGIATPINQTLVAVVKGKESHYLR